MLSRTTYSNRYKYKSLLKNKEDIEFSNIETQLVNWNIPKVSPDKIYDTGMFKIYSAMSIKTIEQTIPIGSFYDSIQLLTEPEINRYKDKYKYLHIGLVQVALKPLTTEGLNTSLLIVLRDCKHNEFSDSLLGIIKSSLCNGHVYFDCHPNLFISLSEKNIFDVLTLNLQLAGYDMKVGSEHVNLTYRIYYKVMNTLSPNAHMYDYKDKTILL